MYLYVAFEVKLCSCVRQIICIDCRKAIGDGHGSTRLSANITSNSSLIEHCKQIYLMGSLILISISLIEHLKQNKVLFNGIQEGGTFDNSYYDYSFQISSTWFWTTFNSIEHSNNQT